MIKKMLAVMIALFCVTSLAFAAVTAPKVVKHKVAKKVVKVKGMKHVVKPVAPVTPK